MLPSPRDTGRQSSAKCFDASAPVGVREICMCRKYNCLWWSAVAPMCAGRCEYSSSLGPLTVQLFPVGVVTCSGKTKKRKRAFRGRQYCLRADEWPESWWHKPLLYTPKSHLPQLLHTYVSVFSNCVCVPASWSPLLLSQTYVKSWTFTICRYSPEVSFLKLNNNSKHQISMKCSTPAHLEQISGRSL
jgi:hypothetical protein